ncbi:MAG: hypothetical protein ABFD92_18910 [Planctomycetaceae bacterium]|nr:hypothetical protein [Planctomycetaceae bacterium]
MALNFSASVDDVFVNLSLQTVVDLPTSGETVLHFCEAVRKKFPLMTSFYRREEMPEGESGPAKGAGFVLEGDRDQGTYQWLEISGNQMTAGWFNPDDLETVFQMHSWLLDRSTYFLGVTGIDIESVEILIGFNLEYRGNRDQVVAAALLDGSPLGALLQESLGPTIECEPNIVMALDEDCCMQGRLYLATRNNSYQVRTGRYSPDPISVYYAVRNFPRMGQVMDVARDFPRQCRTCEDMVRRVVVPGVVRPIATAIAAQ